MHTGYPPFPGGGVGDSIGYKNSTSSTSVPYVPHFGASL